MEVRLQHNRLYEKTLTIKKAQAYLDKFKVETPITRRQAAIDDKIQKDREAKKSRRET